MLLRANTMKTHMFRPSAIARPAAALLAAALVVIGAACGGDDAPQPSASPSSSGVTPGPSASASPGLGLFSDRATDLRGLTPLLTALGEGGEDLLTSGASIALGDFNDDGAPDVLIGASGGDGPDGKRTDAGEAYVIFGPFEGRELELSNEADVTIFGASPGDNLGFTVLAGDLNDDGTDDILVGAPGVTAGFDLRTDQGRVYVFYGRAELQAEYDLAADVFDFTVTGSEGFSRLSTGMDMGDVNGDGRTDLVVGSPFAGREPGSPPGSQRTGVGEAYIVFGRDDDLAGEINIAALQQDVLISGKQGGLEFGQFGTAIAVADLDDDGTDDVIVGANRENASDDRKASGAAYVFFGRSNWDERVTIQEDAQDVTILGAAAGAQLGFPMSVGDFNGDGADDIAMGAQVEANGNTTTAGAVHVFFGGDGFEGTIDLATDQADVTVRGPDSGDIIPSSLSAADLDGDGDSDLALGNSFSGGALGRHSAGLVHVLLGDPSLAGEKVLYGEALARPVIGKDLNDQFGAAVAAGRVSSDSNGLAVVAVRVDASQELADTGAVYVVINPQ